MSELAPHQRSAVERALEMLDRYGGVLLADEVGLGKSYVAAAVARAMQERGHDVELIVPASLIGQWKEVARDFGVRAGTFTHDSIIQDRQENLSLTKRLLVIDEAHGFRNPRTQRWAALARRSVGARLMLVTATPICNSADDLFSLIALIAADDALRHLGVASIERAFANRDARALDAIVSELVIRRDRDVLPPALQFGELDRRVIRHRVPALAIDALQFPLVGDGTHHALLRRFLWRRLESSEAALLESLRRQTRFYERALDAVARGRTLTRGDYRRAFAADDESGALQQVLFWDFFATGDAAASAGEIRDEMARIDALVAEARAAPREKRETLIDVLDDEPTLIFTGAIATARDIADALRCAIVTSRGAQPRNAIDAFRRGSVDRLVATDLAAEGLNLQRAAVVVHYDIPWNPVKLDQRNGRAHRIGQKRPSVHAIYFMPERDRTHIVETIETKNRTRARLLHPTAPLGPPTTLPPHLPHDAAAVALIRAGANIPELALRRFRAGAEHEFAELARGPLDERKVRQIVDLERLI
jgi:superfamily II DNA or RNA helicase